MRSFLRAALHAGQSAILSLGAFGIMIFLLDLRPEVSSLSIEDAPPPPSALFAQDVAAAIALHDLANNPPPPPPPPLEEVEEEPAEIVLPEPEPEPIEEEEAAVVVVEATSEEATEGAADGTDEGEEGVTEAAAVVSIRGTVPRTPRPPRKRTCEEASDAIQALGEDRYAVERDLVDYYAGDIQEAMKLAYVSWYRVEGEIVGFQVRRIRCGSVLEQAGFRNGDVIRSINGKPVTTIPQALFAYRKLRKKRQLEVDVQRKSGEQVLLRYRLT